MKRNIVRLLLFLLTVCFVSCEKDIEFKGAVTDPLLVLNSILTPDSAVSLHLSQSRFVLGESSQIPFITDATVSLFVNGALKEQLMHVEKGIYTGSYFPKQGDAIKIEVVADGYDRVASQAVIPKRPAVAVTDSTVTVTQNESNDPYQSNVTYKTTDRSLQLQLRLTDAANEENYYYIKASEYYYQYGELIMVNPIDLELSEILKWNVNDSGNGIDELFGDEYYTDGIDNLFTDQLVNGKDIVFDFYFMDTLDYSTYVDGEEIDNGAGDPMTVERIIEIGEISRDLYQYVISGKKAENANDSPFAEPVKVHSNIENGVGILGAYNTYRCISRFEIFTWSYLY